MPVYHSGQGGLADWCELEYFDVVDLAPGQTHTYDRVSRKEKLIVAKGRCRVSFQDNNVDAESGANLDLLGADVGFKVDRVTEVAVLVRMCGHWGEDVGGSGLFASDNVDDPVERGDPTDYAKTTNFDNHWHDCDEYWIAYEGRAEVVSEGRHYTIGPGDCLATAAGHHHDVKHVIEPFKGVYFETTLSHQKRRGHLWEHTHGPAGPDPARV